MIKVGIIGATGYAGAELIRLLLSHSGVKISKVSSVSFLGKKLSEVYPSLNGFCDDVLVEEDEVIANSDVVFAALPHGLSEILADKCTKKGVKLIDLGADFRLSDENEYAKWYNLEYKYKALHNESVYCIPELHRDRICKNTQIVGNPGCYPTSVALGLAPALKAGLVSSEGIIIDSKSGVTGAGRGLTLGSHFPECNENFAPYKIAMHRHTPEIEQTVSEIVGKKTSVLFVPHLLPINRGIESTIYAKANSNYDEIYKAYCDFYKDEQFVRVLDKGSIANIKSVKYSNICDISLHLDERTNTLIIVSVIDNMVKGAAGQAIQNMNLLFGYKESEGLSLIAPTN